MSHECELCRLRADRKRLKRENDRLKALIEVYKGILKKPRKLDYEDLPIG